MGINYLYFESGNKFWNWVRVPSSCYKSLPVVCRVGLKTPLTDSVCVISCEQVAEVMSVCCGQHSAAVAAGFRNSGLSVSKHGKIIAVSYCYVMVNLLH